MSPGVWEKCRWTAIDLLKTNKSEFGEFQASPKCGSFAMSSRSHLKQFALVITRPLGIMKLCVMKWDLAPGGSMTVIGVPS